MMVQSSSRCSPINGAFHNDFNMLSLQKQLHVLDMTGAVQGIGIKTSADSLGQKNRS
jgi:hypothetical protein